jgi:hypothetical protein
MTDSCHYLFLSLPHPFSFSLSQTHTHTHSIIIFLSVFFLNNVGTPTGCIFSEHLSIYILTWSFIIIYTCYNFVSISSRTALGNLFKARGVKNGQMKEGGITSTIACPATMNYGPTMPEERESWKNDELIHVNLR